MSPKAFQILAELGLFPPRREEENRGVYKTLVLSPVLIFCSQEELRLCRNLLDGNAQLRAL